MTNFTIIWEVKYYDHEPEKIYYVKELEQAENIDSLLDYLEENAMDHEPENETPTGLGDFNIEYILIKDSETKEEVWRDEYHDFAHYNRRIA